MSVCTFEGSEGTLFTFNEDFTGDVLIIRKGADKELGGVAIASVKDILEFVALQSEKENENGTD